MNFAGQGFRVSVFSQSIELSCDATSVALELAPFVTYIVKYIVNITLQFCLDGKEVFRVERKEDFGSFSSRNDHNEIRLKGP